VYILRLDGYEVIIAFFQDEAHRFKGSAHIKGFELRCDCKFGEL
jgi:hypothetical protein